MITRNGEGRHFSRNYSVGRASDENWIFAYSRLQHRTPLNILKILNIQPTLLRLAVAVRTKPSLDRKLCSSRKRIRFDEDAVIAPIELDRLTSVSVDDFRLAENLDLVAADLFEVIEFAGM